MAPPGWLIRYVGVHVEAEEATQIITNFHFRHSSHGTRFNGPKGNALLGMPLNQHLTLIRTRCSD